MTDERRFNERETRLIMEQASAAHEAALRLQDGGDAESAAVALPVGRGLSLAQLTDIGADVGIPAEFVARSALAVERGQLEPTRTHRWYGLPVGVSRSVDFGRSIDDAEWDRLVVMLRETFQARGHLQREGAFRQWTNGNLQALLEPTTTGHRLRLTTRKGDAKSTITVGAGLLGAAVALGLTYAGVGAEAAANAPYWVPAMLGALGLGSIASTGLRLPSWARTRAKQMETITATAVPPSLGQTRLPSP